MTLYTSAALAQLPWIVSCDTLRTEDLLVKFWSAAETCAVLSERPELINPETLANLERLVGEDSRESDWLNGWDGIAGETWASITLGELHNTLNDAAPAGFGFGASEGDGACFGFWLSEDWRDALETLGLGGDDPTGWAELIDRLADDGIDPGNVADAYQGRAEGCTEERAGAWFACELADALGVKLDQMAWPLTCVDWEAAWRELAIGDGYRLHSIGGGEWLVFRDV